MINTQEYESISCPWGAVIDRYFNEFMQFYYPAAYAEIEWLVPVQQDEQSLAEFVPGDSLGANFLQKLVRVRLKSGRDCRLLIFLGWQRETVVSLAHHLYQLSCFLYSRSGEPVACFALLASVPPEAQNARHSSMAIECLGSQFGVYFPCVYFSDFDLDGDALRREDNAFALLSLAQLIQMRTQDDMAARYAEKWVLTQSLFGRGWSYERINLLFLALDWSLPLPLRLSQALWREIERFEEQQIMRYVSSVERFIREQERQQGCREGEVMMLQHLLVQRFGELPLWVGMQLQTCNGKQRIFWLQRCLVAGTLEEVFCDEV
jgi:hypothetical protein